MVSSLNNRPWLAFMEKLVGGSVPSPRETELPQLFCCRLEEQPDHLVAGRYLTSQAGADLVNDRFLVNPNCICTKYVELSVEFRDSCWHFFYFDLQVTFGIVKLPILGTDVPFWLRRV